MARIAEFSIQAKEDLDYFKTTGQIKVRKNNFGEERIFKIFG